MAYVAPVGTNVNFLLSNSYVAPLGGAVLFDMLPSPIQSGLDLVFGGQPFLNVAMGAIDTNTLDVAFQGQPFSGGAATVVVAGSGAVKRPSICAIT